MHLSFYSSYVDTLFWLWKYYILFALHLLLQVLFSYEEFVRYFNWDNTDLAPCGLMNCGNRFVWMGLLLDSVFFLSLSLSLECLFVKSSFSCFANVILQCLSWTRPLVAYLLERGHRSECKVLSFAASKLLTFYFLYALLNFGSYVWFG